MVGGAAWTQGCQAVVEPCVQILGHLLRTATFDRTATLPLPTRASSFNKDERRADTVLHRTATSSSSRIPVNRIMIVSSHQYSKCTYGTTPQVLKESV